MSNFLDKDIIRYGGVKKASSAMPRFQRYFRKTAEAKNPLIRALYRKCFYRTCKKYCVEMSPNIQIGAGLYFGHPYGITINTGTTLGSNVNIHKGVTIGQENRGKRKGVPVIGNDVWIGVNATIVGNIHIGNDVLIAPNSYVNFDVPNHSIAIGNPAKLVHRDNATEGYINNRV